MISKISKENLVAILGNRQSGFLVDVLWKKGTEDKNWNTHKVDLDTEGVHQFRNTNYLKNKI